MLPFQLRQRERERERERHGYLISRIRGSLCAPMSRFSTTRLFFPTAICRVLARSRQTKQQTPTGEQTAHNSGRRCAVRDVIANFRGMKNVAISLTECNIFRAKPIFDKTNFQRTPARRGGSGGGQITFAIVRVTPRRRKCGGFKNPGGSRPRQTGIAKCCKPENATSNDVLPKRFR